MPLRAFIDSEASRPSAGGVGSRGVLMPLRAFIDSEHPGAIGLCRIAVCVLMPLRAFIDSEPGFRALIFRRTYAES